MSKIRAQRSAAVVAAIGFAFASATVGAPAFAQTTAPAAPVSVVNAGTPTSLTINKYLNPETTGTPTGNATDPFSGTPLAGVEFTITEILYNGARIDMTNNAVFQQAAKLTPATIAAPFSLGTATKVETGADGTVKTSLPQGVYLVQETSLENADVPPNTTITRAADFIAFLPMTQQNGDNITWLYDVNAFPKNSSASVSKSVVDALDNVGDALEYTIKTDVPRKTNTTEVLYTYNVVDVLDTRLTPPAAGDVKVQIDGVDVPATYYSVTVTGQEVKVTFTPEGAKWLQDNHAGKQVTTIIPAVINASGVEATVDGLRTFDPIKNKATLQTNNGTWDGTNVTPPTDEPDETPTNEVVTYIGKLDIAKTDKNGEALNGAEFQLYRCDVTSGALGDGPLTVNGANTWTTGAAGVAGEIIIDGLHVSDFSDNAAHEEAYKYCLVETKAPEGYELLPSPVVVTFTKAGVENTSDGTDAQTYGVTIENVAEVTDRLPSTGGMGVGLLIAAGAGIVGAGAYAAKRNSDKGQANA